MKAENIANKARKSLSKFCMDECRAYCCRKGYLVMNKKEFSLIPAQKRKKLFDKNIVKEVIPGKYSLYLEGEGGCPHLYEYKCMVHKKRNRPKACREFPVFIVGKTVRLSPRCLAVKQGKLYPYEHKLIKLGYKIAKSHPAADYGLYQVELKP